MSFPSVSHHLRVLKDAELVSAEREGQSIRYRINTTVSQDLVRYLMKLLGRR
jgi:DNA-binding transcriptional ArsR family regulator